MNTADQLPQSSGRYLKLKPKKGLSMDGPMPSAFSLLRNKRPGQILGKKLTTPLSMPPKMAAVLTTPVAYLTGLIRLASGVAVIREQPGA